MSLDGFIRWEQIQQFLWDYCILAKSSKICVWRRCPTRKTNKRKIRGKNLSRFPLSHELSWSRKTKIYSPPHVTFDGTHNTKEDKQ